jgi:hypothetical protein
VITNISKEYNISVIRVKFAGSKFFRNVGYQNILCCNPENNHMKPNYCGLKISKVIDSYGKVGPDGRIKF